MIVDLTHILNNNTPVYPGENDIPPEFKQTATVVNNGYSNFFLITGMHVGTHIDAPAHMIAEGKTINEIPVEQLCGKAYLVDAHGKKIIDSDLLEHVQIDPDTIVLIMTGYDRYFHEERYFADHPLFTEDFAHELVKKSVKMVGIDMPSPDRFPFDIHKILFKNDIPIIENLTHLEKLVGAQEIEIFALPLRSETDSAPARVIAKIYD